MQKATSISLALRAVAVGHIGDLLAGVRMVTLTMGGQLHSQLHGVTMQNMTPYEIDEEEWKRYMSADSEASKASERYLTLATLLVEIRDELRITNAVLAGNPAPPKTEAPHGNAPDSRASE